MASKLPSEIFRDLLYLGSASHATYAKQLQSLNIKRVVNATNHHDMMPDEEKHDETGKTPKLNRFFVDVRDDDTAEIGSYFEGVCKFIDDGILSDDSSKPEPALVHCQAGRSRSSTLVVAYVLWRVYALKKKKSTSSENTNIIRLGSNNPIDTALKNANVVDLSSALLFVKSKRSEIYPNCAFLRQLVEFETQLNNNEQVTFTLPQPFDIPYQAHMSEREGSGVEGVILECYRKYMSERKRLEGNGYVFEIGVIGENGNVVATDSSENRNIAAVNENIIAADPALEKISSQLKTCFEKYNPGAYKFTTTILKASFDETEHDSRKVAGELLVNICKVSTFINLITFDEVRVAFLELEGDSEYRDDLRIDVPLEGQYFGELRSALGINDDCGDDKT